MNEEQSVTKRTTQVPWPPVIYAGGFVGAIVLDFLELFRVDTTDEILTSLGYLLFFGGVALAAIAIIQFKAAGTAIDPRAEPEKLVTNGLYGYSRNPMYMAACIIFLGIGFVLSMGSFWAVIPLMMYALLKFAIDPEEARLQAKFGDAYAVYRKKVRRWL